MMIALAAAAALYAAATCAPISAAAALRASGQALWDGIGARNLALWGQMLPPDAIIADENGSVLTRSNSLLSETRDAFFVPDDPRERRIFQHDAKGQVIGFTERRKGQNIIGMQVPWMQDLLQRAHRPDRSVPRLPVCGLNPCRL